MDPTWAVALITACLALAYWYCVWSYGYWKRRGVFYVEPTFPYGNLKGSSIFSGPLQTRYQGYVFQEFYNSGAGHQYVGIYNFMAPCLMLRDPEAIKLVMTKEFKHFGTHGLLNNYDYEPLNGHLFHAEGDMWKQLRVQLTPTFTSGKMKMMFTLMNVCAEELAGQLVAAADSSREINVKDMMSRFTIDVIGTCAYGVEINSLRNQNSKFREYGLAWFRPNFLMMMRTSCVFLLPWLARILRVRSNPADMTDFFDRLVKDTVQYREKHGVVRDDFLALLIQLKNKGYVEADTDERKTIKEEANGKQKQNNGVKAVDNGKASGNYMSYESMAAQCFVFFLANYETASSVLTFCLYEMAMDQDLQQRVRKELDGALLRHGGRITYQALQECLYMDKVVAETMRKYPTLPVLHRRCTKTYRFPGTDHVIEEGTRIQIPVFAIHHDPHIYPQPERFLPERFDEEVKRSRHPYTYLPFGEGPRICIGQRFGVLQVKLGLATMLSRLEMTLSPKTPTTLDFEPTCMATSARNEILLRLARRR